MNRRTLLARAVALGAVGLAGCMDGEEPANGTTADGDSTATTETTGTTETTVTTATDATPAETEPETATDTTPGTATATGTEAGRATETASATTTPVSTATPDSPREAVTVTVGANGRARFAPESFTLAQGGTVTWVWKGGGHDVVPERQPSGASWEGTPGGPSKTYDTGHAYEETFDVVGDYRYYCNPHRSIGMTGSFTVE